MNEIEIVKYFNIVLLSEKDDKFFNIHECLVPKHLKYETKQEKEYFGNLETEIIEFAKSRKYFNQFNNGSFELTDKGEKAKRKGGHFEFEKYENNKENKIDEILDLDIKLKKFELKFGNKILVTGIVFTVLNFLITFATLEFWKRDENKNEQKKQVVNPKKIEKQETIKDSLN
ncbi:hypothetical protein [Polaribacter sp.]|uniref:hypothetical protein n=1 Tax=Polaribacter sp. TaxID=1920175 RepID=UPI0040471029